MGTIRAYAQKVGFDIVGKLRACPELNYGTCQYTGLRIKLCGRTYMDDANNEYYVDGKQVCITTADGGVI